MRRLKKAIESGHGDRWELAFPSRYIKGADLLGRDVNLTIADIEPGHELMGSNGEKDSGLVLYFEETKKMMVLNKTNARTIASLYGNELTRWVGKRITLYPAMVQAFGAEHEALRVRPKVPPAKKRKGQATEAEPPHDPDTGEVLGDEAHDYGPPPMTDEELGEGALRG